MDLLDLACMLVELLCPVAADEFQRMRWVLHSYALHSYAQPVIQTFELRAINTGCGCEARISTHLTAAHAEQFPKGVAPNRVHQRAYNPQLR